MIVQISFLRKVTKRKQVWLFGENISMNWEESFYEFLQTMGDDFLYIAKVKINKGLWPSNQYWCRDSLQMTNGIRFYANDKVKKKAVKMFDELVLKNKTLEIPAVK